MWFSLILISSAGLLYLIHEVAHVADLPYANPVASLMGGVALVGMILSVACFFMNMGKMKLKKKKAPIPWMIVSIIAFLAFTGFIVVIIVDRARVVGISF